MENGPDFYQKRKNLFDCLDEAEKSLNSDSTLKQHTTVTLDQLTPASRHDNKRRKTVIRSSASRKESIFKRPELPIDKCMPMRHVPDFKVNPHKWKKYSLEDADCSDRTNTAAAFNFLREIEKRKEEEMEQEGSNTEQKIIFKKSSKFERNTNTEEESSTLKGSKVVMPEYVVGQKVTKKEKKAKSCQSSSDKKKTELKLDHLLDEEEDEET